MFIQIFKLKGFRLDDVCKDSFGVQKKESYFMIHVFDVYKISFQDSCRSFKSLSSSFSSRILKASDSKDTSCRLHS